MSTAILIENLSKFYQTGTTTADTLGGSLWQSFKNLSNNSNHKINRIWALKGLSLEIKQGEILGIIGHNGAGKSTLLKILARIASPSTGKVMLWGKVASMLEVGTGFHPDLSGRENIFLNGAMLGMKKEQVKRQLDEIIAFSGIEKFIDFPIKKYSTGMKVRLAFAVAAHLQADIMLLDEVLAVGDAAFQQKCLGKIDEISKGGRTILFVSHNLGAVKNLCTRAICLQNAQLVREGAPDEVISAYLKEGISGKSSVDAAEITRRIIIEEANTEKPTIQLLKLQLLDSDFQLRNTFYSDEEINISFEFEAFTEIKDLRAIIQLVDEENQPIITTQASDNANYIEKNYLIQKGKYLVSCKIPANLLGKSRFYVTVRLIHPNIENIILHKGVDFQVQFKGYNNIQVGAFAESYLRPQLPWQFNSLNSNYIGKSSKFFGA